MPGARLSLKNPRPMVDRPGRGGSGNRCREREDETAATPTFERIWRAANRAAGPETEESADADFLAARRRCPISTSPGTVERSRHGTSWPR